jgi:spore germination protein KC
MIKKAGALLLILALMFTGGCWDYRSLSDLTIVIGMSIDRCEVGYDVTYEAIDISEPIKQSGVKHMLIESRGKTLFDAARNAKKRNDNKLYFGHMQLVILSRDVAENVDIDDIMDWYLRDAELRETLLFAVSQEATAKELLTVTGEGNPLITLELQKIIQSDNASVSSTLFYELYNMYNVTELGGKTLAMPLLRIVHSEDIGDIEVDGTAVFNNEHMIGTLSPEESKYLLFVLGKVEGGLLTFPSTDNGEDDSALEISENRTSRSFTVKDGMPVITVKTDTEAFLGEYKQLSGELNREVTGHLISHAQQTLARRIGDVIARVQNEFGGDIFGFGSMVSKQDPALWATLKDNWNETFSSVEVNIECKINIVNTALIKE